MFSGVTDRFRCHHQDDNFFLWCIESMSSMQAKSVVPYVADTVLIRQTFWEIYSLGFV